MLQPAHDRRNFDADLSFSHQRFHQRGDTATHRRAYNHFSLSLKFMSDGSWCLRDEFGFALGADLTDSSVVSTGWYTIDRAPGDAVAADDDGTYRVRCFVLKSKSSSQGSAMYVNAGVTVQMDWNHFDAVVSGDFQQVSINKVLKNCEDGDVKTMYRGGRVSDKHWEDMDEGVLPVF